MSVSSATLAALLLLACAPTVCGQSSLPSAPVPAQATRNDSYLYNAGVFCGVGAGTSALGARAGLGCGAGINFVPLPIFLEVGLMDPQTNRNSFTGYVSVDGSIPLARTTNQYLPMAIVGYSRLFESGHALDYGLALAMPRPGKTRDSGKSMRIEMRDYWAIGNPNPHSIMLRVGWMSRVRD